MGKFINTEHMDMVDSITKGVVQEAIKNPYYLFENTKATPVTFYELHSEQSTLDDSARIEYNTVGDKSPLRFKKIEGVYLYGLGRMEISYHNGDNGLEADPISGDCTDLPNTIHPTPGCFFEIPYLNESNKHFLFTITDVSDDTMDNGQNIHRMSYELEYTDEDSWNDLQKQVVEDYRFIPGNVGTENNSVILSSRYDLAEKLDELLTIYRKYYTELFYNERVQTFTFQHLTGYNINDSYLVEFLIRNKIMNGGSADYLYVSHKNPVSSTFSLDYAKSLYRAVETNDLEAAAKARIKGQYLAILNQYTIFYTRQESYYSVDYNLPVAVSSVGNMIEAFDPDFVRNLVEGKLYDYSDKRSYLNIIIKYMHGMIPVCTQDAYALENVQYEESGELYYSMPLVMYCIEKYIKTLITQHTNN